MHTVIPRDGGNHCCNAGAIFPEELRENSLKRASFLNHIVNLDHVW